MKIWLDERKGGKVGWEESMWEMMIIQISNKPFIFRSFVLKILLLQSVHLRVHGSLLLFQICMKFVVSTLTIPELVHAW